MERPSIRGYLRTLTTVQQLSLFVLIVVAGGQLFVTALSARVVFRENKAFDLTWAVGLPSMAAVPCYFVALQSLKRAGQRASWSLRFAVASVIAATLLYVSFVAFANLYGT